MTYPLFINKYILLRNFKDEIQRGPCSVGLNHNLEKRISIKKRDEPKTRLTYNKLKLSKSFYLVK